MKVLYILKSLEKGGAERYVIDLCLYLNKIKDIEYRLLILQEGNQFEYLTDQLNIIQADGPFIPSILRKSIVNIEQYKNILNEFKPDIIHTNLFRAELYSSIYVLKDVVYVTHGHDNMKEYKNFSIKTLFNKHLLTCFYEKCYLIYNKYRVNKNFYVIANSPDTYDYFKNTLPGFLKNNVKLIEYGFDFDRFYFPNRKHHELKATIKLIYIGRYAVYKNHVFVVEIAKELKRLKANFEITLLGDGVEFNNVKQLVYENNLQTNVIMLGNVDFVEKYLQESDIYIHTAYYEPFGLVLLEAMASGLPCIILNGKGNKYIIKEGFNGYMFNEQDPKLFADKIVSLHSDKELWRLMSKNAQDYASTYKIEDKTTELLNFYKELITKKNE